MNLKSAHSKDYHSYLNNVIENELLNSPNIAELWIKMGEELEIENIPKSQISSIIRKDIEDKLFEKQKLKQPDLPREECKYHSGYYYKIMSQQGWTSSAMAITPLKEQEIVPYTNPEMKEVCYDIINLCRIMIDKSKDTISFEDVFGAKEMREFYKQRHTIINNCKIAIDNKTKIPKNTELFLLEYLATLIESVNKCAEIFMEQNLIRLKKQLTISVRTGKPVPFLTTKQASKFQRDMNKKQLHILQPNSRDQALFLDYVGVQCQCGGWRVRQKNDSYKLECYDCNMTLPPAHISKCSSCKVPLYKERLLHIVKTGKCENCNDDIDLPQELIECARA